MRRLSSGLLVVGLAALSVSCGGVREEKLSDTGNSLEGTVKYGGEDIQFAVVVINGGGTTGGGNVNEEGRYKAGNLPVGEVSIGVDSKAASGDYRSKMMASAYQGAKGKGKVSREVKFIDIPAKYADPNTSGLKTTIKPGANTFDIVIPK